MTLTFRLPILQTPDEVLNQAFRIAMGDLVSNISVRNGVLVLNAGLDYPTPWIRDTAINIWNGTSLIFPDVMKNNLLSLIDDSENINPAGQYAQYWDVAIWCLGAWWHYLYTADEDFLALAYRVTCNTLHYFEATEFDAEMNLFYGAAVYGDGIAGYPDHYLNNGGSSGILEWRNHNPEKRLPMFALSTNCLYYEVYRIQSQMAAQLRLDVGNSDIKAERLRVAINKHFWNAAKGTYRYLIDPFGGCDFQEGMGHSFALLFGIADRERAESVIAHQYIAPAGIPCVYPSFERYRKQGGYGRHSGTTWSHIQGLWGDAVQRYGHRDKFSRELNQLACRAVRDGQFAELFHPETGEIYGGLQEGGDEDQWQSCMRQTWSASAFLRLVLMGLCGMQVTPAGVQFLPKLRPLLLDGLCFRGKSLCLHLQSEHIEEVSLN